MMKSVPHGSAKSQYCGSAGAEPYGSAGPALWNHIALSVDKFGP